MEYEMNNFEVEGTLERMKMIKRGAPFSTLWPSDIDNILNALEKQIPKKPIGEKYKLIEGCGKCPNCNNFIDDMSSYRVCSRCGQAIDWSETE